jgi:uncharacterized membrane protein
MTATSIALLVIGILLVVLGVLLLVVRKLRAPDPEHVPVFQAFGGVKVAGPVGLVIIVIGVVCIASSAFVKPTGATSAITPPASPTVSHSSSPPSSPASPSPSPSASPSGTITSPPNGASNVTAHKNLQVSGTAQDIPPGYRLDLVLEFLNVNRYYIAADPNTAITLHNGHWSSPIFIGDPGYIIIRLIMLSPSQIVYVNSQPTYQVNGFPALPGTVLAAASYKSP